MIQKDSPLQHYRQVRERLQRLCEDAAAFAATADLEVINDPLLESWVLLETDETAFASYQRQPLAQLITARAARLRQPFRLAVMGEFSRGKSTFINALLGKELLTTDWRPNTAVRTTIRAGRPQRIRIQYLSGEKPSVKETNDIAHELASLTSDAEGGDNQEGILRGTRASLAQKYREIEVFVDLPFLYERELELIDTPGLESVIESHQDVAYSVLTEAEIIIYAIQFTPGIEEADIAFLRSVRMHKDRFLFLLTKRDHARTAMEVQESISFVEASLRAQVGIKQPKIYPVEAALALNGHASESGMAEALYGIERGLAAIAGVPRLQEMLQFLTTCHYWFSQKLTHETLHLKQTLKLQSQRRELLTYRTDQARQLQKVMRDYARNSFAALLAELKANINELPRRFQFASEAVIDSLVPDMFTLLGPMVINVLQTELQRWLKEKEKHVQRQETGIIDHIRRILTALLPSSSEVSVQVAQHSFAVALNLPTLQPLFAVGIPGIVDLTAKLGIGVALRNAHARYKQHLLAPVAHQHMPFYQIVLDGIRIPPEENQLSREIAIRGIHRDLEQTFTQVCKSLETRCEQLIDAHVRSYLACLEQEGQKLGAASATTKKALDNIAQKERYIDDMKRNVLEIELESKRISATCR
jgi:GTPase SAR1 family protein